MFYQSLTIWYKALHNQFTNDYQWIANTSLPIIALVISSPLVANVLPIIDLPMALGNLPIAGNGLPLVPLGNDMRKSNLGRNELHKMNWGSNFHGGSFSNRDTVRAPIQFRRKSQSKQDDFSLRTDPSIFTSTPIASISFITY